MLGFVLGQGLDPERAARFAFPVGDKDHIRRYRHLRQQVGQGAGDDGLPCLAGRPVSQSPVAQPCLARRVAGDPGRFPCRQAAFHKKVLARAQVPQTQLPGRMEAAHRFAHPRAGGERRQKGLDLVPRRCDRGLEVHRDQRRKRHALRHGSPGDHRFFMRALEQLPFCVLGRCEHRLDAQLAPQLRERAQGRRLGQVLAHTILHLAGRQRPVPLEQLPYLDDQRGAAAARAAGPLTIAAQGIHKRQRFLVGHEVGLIARRAGTGGPQQPQNHGIARGKQPAQQRGGRLDRGRPGRRLTFPEGRLRKRGGGRGDLRGTGKKGGKPGFTKPGGGRVGGQKGRAILPPGGGARVLELFCCQSEVLGLEGG